MEKIKLKIKLHKIKQKNSEKLGKTRKNLNILNIKGLFTMDKNK